MQNKYYTIMQNLGALCISRGTDTGEAVGLDELGHIDENPFSELNFKLTDCSHFSDSVRDAVPLCCPAVAVTPFGQCQPGVRYNDFACHAIIAKQPGQIFWLSALPDTVGAQCSMIEYQLVHRHPT